MQYLLGFAGVPAEIADDVERESRQFAEKADFFLERLPDVRSPYTAKNSTRCLDRLHARVAQDERNQLRQTGFAIIYVRRDQASTDEFCKRFFPHTLMVGVDWEADLSRGKNSLNQSKNELVKMLKTTAARTRAALRMLHEEIESRASTTSLILPLQNFKSGTFRDNLFAFAQRIAQAPETDHAQMRDEFLAEFQRGYPRTQIKGHKRPCFVDDRGVEFHPPGNARHAFSRGGQAHETHCLLSGRRRLGAPYDPLFHYDCAKGETNLKGRFAGCHSTFEQREGKPHLNIAPNDHVRGG